MTAREKRFVICVQNRGAEDLDVRKVYRVLLDKAAAVDGYLRVIDESGEDYLYPERYFVFVALPKEAKRAWADAGRTSGRRSGPPSRAYRRTAASGRR